MIFLPFIRLRSLSSTLDAHPPSVLYLEVACRALAVCHTGLALRLLTVPHLVARCALWLVIPLPSP